MDSKSQNSQSQASSVLFKSMCSRTSSSPKAHTHHAIRHSKRECHPESVSSLQIEQASVVAILFSCRVIPMCRDICDSLHTKTLTFDGTLTIHKTDHDFFSCA